jgi:uncharacterized protein YndB with AHSA1/START domain
MAEAIIATASASMTIKASPEKVFDAWLDPKQLARFMAAGDMTAKIDAIDAKVGGAFRFTMTGTENTFVHEGRYVAIERPRRLIFTWVSEGSDWRLSLVTVTFVPVPDGVRVELVHEGLPAGTRVDLHRNGWGSILNKLAGLY